MSPRTSRRFSSSMIASHETAERRRGLGVVGEEPRMEKPHDTTVKSKVITHLQTDLKWNTLDPSLSSLAFTSTRGAASTTTTSTTSIYRPRLARSASDSIRRRKVEFMDQSDDNSLSKQSGSNNSNKNINDNTASTFQRRQDDTHTHTQSQLSAFNPRNYLPRLRSRTNTNPKRWRWGDKKIRRSRTLDLSTQQQQQQRRPCRWLIPADHPLKMLWDVLTVTLSFANAYMTHVAIRERNFADRNGFIRFCEIWFILDILLNFVTEYRTGDGMVWANYQAVWARYLTSWFVVDVLSLLPAELMYVQPILEEQKKRGWFKRNFFRTRAVVRFTRILRGRHLKWFSRVAKQSKHVGMTMGQFLRVIIQYVPKYFLFLKNMKGVVAIRILRQVRWLARAWADLCWALFPQQRQVIVNTTRASAAATTKSSAPVAPPRRTRVWPNNHKLRSWILLGGLLFERKKKDDDTIITEDFDDEDDFFDDDDDEYDDYDDIGVDDDEEEEDQGSASEHYTSDEEDHDFGNSMIDDEGHDDEDNNNNNNNSLIMSDASWRRHRHRRHVQTSAVDDSDNIFVHDDDDDCSSVDVGLY